MLKENIYTLNHYKKHDSILRASCVNREKQIKCSSSINNKRSL